ncbi:methyltransferase domain-containing protein [Micromonospora sp. CPCC 205371]|nr:methyltransferase domain-containing protein [Micromonospora sp. CPCC 205371]
MRLTSTKTPDQLGFWNEWHRARGATGQDLVHLESRSTFLRGLEPLGKRLTVLDLGCGEGHDVVALTSAGHRVCGIDFSPVAIAKAQRSIPWRRRFWPVRPLLRVADIAQRLPFTDEKFDGVFSHLALHYFQDQVTRSVFQEIARVTRPGGILVFTVKSTADPYFRVGDQLDDRVFCRKGHVRHFFTAEYIETLLDGWKIDDIQPREGHYASPEKSAFLIARAHRPG